MRERVIDLEPITAFHAVHTISLQPCLELVVLNLIGGLARPRLVYLPRAIQMDVLNYRSGYNLGLQDGFGY